MLTWLSETEAVPRWFLIPLIAMLLVDQLLIGAGFRLQRAWRDLYMRSHGMLDDALREQQRIDDRTNDSPTATEA